MRRLPAALFPVVIALGGAPLAAPAPAARADDAIDPVEKAIARVYPALVQIHVLSLEHEGGRERKYQASGSGAIISRDGYVVTNHHVAGRATGIRCILSTREDVPATLVGTDVLADIAVLRLDLSARASSAAPIEPAVFGSSAELRVGDVVLAMGCPLALSHSVTKGIVANKDMMMPQRGGGAFMLDGEDVGSLVKWIGHDATIQPGNSGGPLVSLAGEIIGVNEIGVGTMSGAIPSDLARRVCDDLIAHGRVRRAWIGAEFQTLLKGPTGTAEAKGVLVGGVLPGSPAERAGLRAGDVIEAVDGAPVNARFREELPAFHDLLLSKPLGRPIAVTARRGAEALAVSITPEPREDAIGKEVESRPWGLTVREITTPVAQELRRDKSGVLVGSARGGSPASQAVPAIQPGDVIVSIDGKPVADLAAFERMTEEITRGAAAPVPTLVGFERRAERFLTLVEVGVRPPQPPTPEAKKAWFPAQTQVLSRKLATALGLKGKKGVRISQVYPESAAEKAGFLVGDVLTHIDGQPIEASEPHDARVFGEMIRAYRIDQKAAFTVWREGRKLEVECVLGEAPKPERELAVHEDTSLEFSARDVSYFDRVERRWAMDQRGALVTQVEAGGWAAVGGLRSGDLVLAVDGRPVEGAEALGALLKPLAARRVKRAALLVRRGIHTMFVEIEPS
jgi:serine protease Do